MSHVCTIQPRFSNVPMSNTEAVFSWVFSEAFLCLWLSEHHPDQMWGEKMQPWIFSDICCPVLEIWVWTHTMGWDGPTGRTATESGISENLFSTPRSCNLLTVQKCSLHPVQMWIHRTLAVVEVMLLLDCTVVKGILGIMFSRHLGRLSNQETWFVTGGTHDYWDTRLSPSSPPLHVLSHYLEQTWTLRTWTCDPGFV